MMDFLDWLMCDSRLYRQWRGGVWYLTDTPGSFSYDPIWSRQSAGVIYEVETWEGDEPLPRKQ